MIIMMMRGMNENETTEPSNYYFTKWYFFLKNLNEYLFICWMKIKIDLYKTKKIIYLFSFNRLFINYNNNMK